MKETMKWTRNTDTESTSGQTVVNTREIGSMENNTDRATIFSRMELSK